MSAERVREALAGRCASGVPDDRDVERTDGEASGDGTGAVGEGASIDEIKASIEALSDEDRAALLGEYRDDDVEGDDGGESAKGEAGEDEEKDPEPTGQASDQVKDDDQDSGGARGQTAADVVAHFQSLLHPSVRGQEGDSLVLRAVREELSDAAFLTEQVGLVAGRVSEQRQQPVPPGGASPAPVGGGRTDSTGGAVASHASFRAAVEARMAEAKCTPADATAWVREHRPEVVPAFGGGAG